MICQGYLQKIGNSTLFLLLLVLLPWSKLTLGEIYHIKQVTHKIRFKCSEILVKIRLFFNNILYIAYPQRSHLVWRVLCYLPQIWELNYISQCPVRLHHPRGRGDMWCISKFPFPWVLLLLQTLRAAGGGGIAGTEITHSAITQLSGGGEKPERSFSRQSPWLHTPSTKESLVHKEGTESNNN